MMEIVHSLHLKRVKLALLLLSRDILTQSLSSYPARASARRPDSKMLLSLRI